MTKSLRYTWPVFAYLIMVVALYIGSLGEIAELVRLRELINVILTVGAIYYLYTSPFSQTHFLPLFTLLIVRLMVPMLVPFNVTTGVSFIWVAIWLSSFSTLFGPSIKNPSEKLIIGSYTW